MKITCQSRPTQIAGLAFALTTLLLIQARSVAAQSPEAQKPTSEVQQLRERLFTSSIGYSMLDISNSDGQAPDAFHRGHYGSGNLLFYPTDNVMVGSEVIWGKRSNSLDGFSSEDVHLQFSFKYNFNKEFKF